jgi:hypothetical protein
MFTETPWRITGSDTRSLSLSATFATAGVGSIVVPITDTRTGATFALSGSGLVGSVGRGSTPIVSVEMSPATFGIDVPIGGAIGPVYKSWHISGELRLNDLLGSWALVNTIGGALGGSIGASIIIFHRPEVMLLEMLGAGSIISTGILAGLCRAVAFFYGTGAVTAAGVGLSGGRYSIDRLSW